LAVLGLLLIIGGCGAMARCAAASRANYTANNKQPPLQFTNTACGVWRGLHGRDEGSEKSHSADDNGDAGKETDKSDAEADADPRTGLTSPGSAVTTWQRSVSSIYSSLRGDVTMARYMLTVSLGTASVASFVRGAADCKTAGVVAAVSALVSLAMMAFLRPYVRPWKNILQPVAQLLALLSSVLMLVAILQRKTHSTPSPSQPDASSSAASSSATGSTASPIDERPRHRSAGVQLVVSAAQLALRDAAMASAALASAAAVLSLLIMLVTFAMQMRARQRAKHMERLKKLQ
jgi:hypothetical protein